MKLRFAKFAVVFVGQLIFVGEAHAASVLPDVAVVALYEKVAQIVCRCVCMRVSEARSSRKHGWTRTWGGLGVSKPRRRTGILSLSTDTPGDLLFHAVDVFIFV